MREIYTFGKIFRIFASDLHYIGTNNVNIMLLNRH